MTQATLGDPTWDDFLDYEIRSSWWASWIRWDWGQTIAGRYFAWKVKIKYSRYRTSKMWDGQIKQSV